MIDVTDLTPEQADVIRRDPNTIVLDRAKDLSKLAERLRDMMTHNKFLRPLFDRVLVELPPPVTESRGGILIPETVAERMMGGDHRKTPPLEGVVIAVGPGGLAPDGTHLPMMVKVGDRVLLHDGPTVGVTWRWDESVDKVGNRVRGKELRLVGQYDLLAVLPS